MLTLNATTDFRELVKAYSCAKCHNSQILIPVLLKTCRHLFCTRCVVISKKQECPICQIAYGPSDVDRGNVHTHKIIDKIKNIDQLFPDKKIHFENLDISSTSFYKENKAKELRQEEEGEASKENNVRVILKPRRSLQTRRQKRSTTAIKAETAGQTDAIIDQETHIENIETQNINNNQQDGVPDILMSDLDAGEFNNVVLCKETLKRNPKGETSMHLACKRGQADVLQELIRSGMDVNCVDFANWTPLHEAVHKADANSVKLLLQAGSLPNVPAQNYFTPLHQAVELKNKEILNLLLQYGADVNATDIYGNSVRSKYSDLPIVVESTEAFFDKKLLVFNCNSLVTSSKRPKVLHYQLLSGISVINGMEYLQLDDDNSSCFFTAEILAALLKAIPMIYQKDVAVFSKSTSLDFMRLIPNALTGSYKKSLRNRLYRLPKLFDGMNIHVPSSIKCYSNENGTYTHDNLRELIEIAGGGCLKRAPSESTVEGINTQPYHCKSHEQLKNCSHYIVYDEKTQPLLLYKMKDLRHVSVSWLLNCIRRFEICPLN